ncbi:MAG TPA: transcriptional regulator [Steroidobacteraceae bacterium]|jgi:DNA-binding transcriptional ArsR family regulator|nr:transcriptional regulator [Steroidobacteraceae bacterium]
MSGRAGAVKRQDAHGSSSAKNASKPSAIPHGTADGGQRGFDRLIYERVRLGIMSALATNEELTFNELKSLFNASDGNLGAHARKLEEAGYVACTKSFEARRPKSIYRITAAGRKALLRYLEHIEAVIKATRRV